MIKLVVMFFLLVNGAPAPEPMGIATYKKSVFPTEEACQEFLKSDEGAVAKVGALEHPLVTSGQATAVFQCVPSGDTI